MKNWAVPTCLLALMVLLLPTTVRAQDLVKDALASFPPQTIRLEYSRPAKLRTLPNYAKLRQRYVGPRLRVLEESLAQLGVQEGDIDELVLGWQAGAGEMDLSGLATGRFDSKAIADVAAARGLSPTVVGEMPAYCFGAETAGSCVVILEKSLGAFGTLGSLGAMLEARSGRAASLGSDERFLKLTREVQAQAPIWGVAVGPAVADWFRGWMPAQGDLQLDWARAFETVEALIYSVDATEKVHLDVKLDCTTPEAATSMRQVLEGLKLFQQLAWQNQNPNRPNPFEAVEVDRNERRVQLKVTTAYTDIEAIGRSGSPRN